MSGYSNANENDLFWNPQEDNLKKVNMSANYGTDYENLQNQGLDFHSFGTDQPEYEKYYLQSFDANSTNFAFQPEQGYNQYYSQSFDVNSENLMQPVALLNREIITPNLEDCATDLDEPPLLEELEIYPDRIIEKMVAVLNPFRGRSLADDAGFLTNGTDLAGPLSFCIILALCLFVSNSKVYFGYIYGLSVISCLMMYWLLSLMTSNKVFTLASVTSILGYSLLPIVCLSILGLFVPLYGLFGISIVVLAVLWSSLSASRLFIAISGDSDQRPLIAYPCALVCGVFALLVVF